jgi:hypothetical protein
MPIGYLMRLEHGGISIEITVSQHYNVINGRSFVKTGFDSCTNAAEVYSHVILSAKATSTIRLRRRYENKISTNHQESPF